MVINITKITKIWKKNKVRVEILNKIVRQVSLRLEILISQPKRYLEKNIPGRGKIWAKLLIFIMACHFLFHCSITYRTSDFSCLG